MQARLPTVMASGPAGGASGRAREAPVLPAVASKAPVAALFPGQGSHVRGMRELLAAQDPELLELVVREVGEDPFAHAERSTRCAQPAIFCASVAAWNASPRQEVGWMAGHSLGEFAALVAAGSLSVADGVRLVALRGRLMEEAAGGDGSMAALIGEGADALGERVSLATGTYVANYNAPTQVVLAGHDAAVDDACRMARELGLRALVLAIRGAFHSPLMASARPRFELALAEVDFSPPRVPVLSCTTGLPFDDVRRRLADAFTEPVRWRAVLETLAASGVRRFLEVGPGRVLTGLVRRTLDGVQASTLQELRDAR